MNRNKEIDNQIEKIKEFIKLEYSNEKIKREQRILNKLLKEYLKESRN